MKLLRKSNLMTVREKSTRKVTLHIEPAEKRRVSRLINEVAYFLYDYYRTGYLAEADDLQDSAVGTVLDWPERKVAKYRVMLEKTNLIRIMRIGTGPDMITKLVVGPDLVALSLAGLPDNVQDYAAFRKLKRDLKITTSDDLLAQLDYIQAYYETHPDQFN